MLGIVTVDKRLEYMRIVKPKNVTPAGIVNEVSAVTVKALLPIVRSEFGNEIETRPVSAKAFRPILVTPSPSSTFVSCRERQNALAGITVIEFGILIEVIADLLNALFSIDVAVASIVTAPVHE